MEVGKIYDTIKIERDNNFILPAWITEQVFQQLEEINQMKFYILGSAVKRQRLRSGLLLKEITEILEKPIDNKRLFVYSTVSFSYPNMNQIVVKNQENSICQIN